MNAEPARTLLPLADEITPLVTRAFEGRRAVIVGGPLSQLLALASHLVDHGAEAVLCAASSIDVAQPQDGTVVCYDAGIRGVDVTTWKDAYRRALQDPDGNVRAALDAFDPAGEAWVLGFPEWDAERIGGRRHVGFMRAEWGRLEDKTVTAGLWERLAGMSAPARVVPADAGELGRALREVSGDHGAVVAVDASAGVTSGAEGLRWVTPSGPDARAILASLPPAERVRVMPFVAGVPCSIDGIVLGDGVAVLQVVEVITLVSRANGRLRYGGVWGGWTMDGAAEGALHRFVEATGRTLAERFAFRGPFSLDGIQTADGFVPTEINPRYSATVRVAGRRLVGPSFGLLMALTMEGWVGDLGAAGLSAASLGAQVRRGMQDDPPLDAYLPLPEPPDRPLPPLELRWTVSGSALPTEPGGQPDATLIVEPGMITGADVRLLAGTQPRTSPEPFTPRFATALELFASTSGVALPDPDLEPACALR